VAVRPFARSGVSVRFAPRRERGVLMRVRLEDGSPLPAGALVRIDGREEVFVAVSGGEVYIPNLEGTLDLSAAWASGSCAFVAAVPDNDDPQPRIDNLVCRSEPRYAAR
jgi:outer membrane usher protein